MDASHSFDDGTPFVTSLWTNAAPQCAKAARRIRALRQLAHYKSAPYLPEANARAERFNRFMAEGTRCVLLQSGLGETWWPLAIVLFCMNFTAFFRRKDGFTVWIRRFGSPHKFRPYPFGALVFYVHPTDAPYPGSKTKDSLTTKNWRSRFVPASVVGISVGPVCQWAESYKVVPLAFLLSEDRASRVSIRTVANVIFADMT